MSWPGAVQAARYSLFLNAEGAGPAPAMEIGNQGRTELFPSATRWAAVQVAPEVAVRGGVALGDDLIVVVFQEPALTVTVDRVTFSALGLHSIRGRVHGSSYGHLLITSRDGRSLADIAVPETGRHYSLVYLPDAERHYVFDLSDSVLGLLENGPPLTAPTEPGEGLWVEQEATILGPHDPAVIDVMMVYTPAARFWADKRGGIDQVMGLAMERAQWVLDNSDTFVSLNLLHAAEVDYVESGDSSLDLRRLTRSQGHLDDPDGAMDEVHEWRDSMGADLVALFAKLDDVGGRGWLLSSRYGQAQYGFSIERVQQAAGHDTLIHELGHNLGAHHHKQQNTAPGPNAQLNTYSAGWRWVGNDDSRYCSTMTYESGSYFADGLTHKRVPFLSNPGVLQTGAPTGDAVDGDNARTVREMKHVVAGYRDRPLSIHVMSGYVRLADGSGISGVLMEGLPDWPTTDKDGYYVGWITGDWSGEVTPNRSGYLFDPPSRFYQRLVEDLGEEDFTGTTCELSEASDLPALDFTTGGHAEWFCQQWTTLDGTDAAVSGDIAHHQQTWMETLVVGPGELSFHWKVSSEGDSDYLEFLVEELRRDWISGEVEWQSRTYQIPPGPQGLQWRYLKDGEGSRGADRGWVDQVVWTRHFTFTVSTSPPEGGRVLGGGTVPSGTQLTLTAVAGEGYDFVGWTEGGLPVSAEAVYGSAATADRELVAHFELRRYTLTYVTGAGGSIQGEDLQTVSHGGNGTMVTAVADAGCHFVQWSDGVRTVSRQDTGGPANLSVSAEFQSSGGVPIEWYAQYGLAPATGQTWSDLDAQDAHGKGMTLRDEYLADTDPRDPRSVFRIVAMESGTPFRVYFEPSSIRRVYTLQFAAGAASADWIDVPGGGPRVGLGGMDSLSDPDAASPLGFYRVLVELPEGQAGEP